jgi:hypothetical protein
MAQSDELVALAEHYAQFTEVARGTHYDRADLNALLNRLVGGAAVVTSAVASTSVLTNLDKNHQSFSLVLAAGILAIIAAVLAGLQTFYKFGEVGERHRLAGAYFGELNRDLELFVRCPAEAERCTQLRELLDRLGKLEEAGPGYPAKVFHEVGGRSRRRWQWPFWRRRQAAERPRRRHEK